VSGEKPFLSVVVPAYQEARRIGPTIERIASYLRTRPFTAELILSDDGSTDATVAVGREAACSAGIDLAVVSEGRNRGKGHAVRIGLLAGRGWFRLFSDADLSTPIEEADRLISSAQTYGAGLVIGSRALPESELVVRQPWARELGGRALNHFVRLVGRIDCTDTQCGFKLLTEQAAEEVLPLLTVTGFGFDVELVLVTLALGFSVRQVPVVWADSRDSRVSPVLDGMRTLRDVVRVRANELRGRYRSPRT